MPRPKRSPDAPEVIDTDVIDETPEQGQSARSGLVEDVELDLARSVAKRAGWADKDAWRGRPEEWTDAPEFLERLPQQLTTLKDRLKRTGQAADDAIEEARRQARIEAQAEIRAAAEAQDPDAAERAAHKLAQASSDPPQTKAWKSRNPWFETDPEASALAFVTTSRLAAQGASIADQLDAAEQAVRKRFPEHFADAPQAAQTETRLSESRRPAPAVTGGSRGAPSLSKEKGFGDIPAGDRALYDKHFRRRYESMGLKPEDAQTKYARSYWANKE